MADFDDLVKQAVRYSLTTRVECEIDDDGDYRVRVRLFWDGTEISESEDYFDGTWGKP